MTDHAQTNTPGTTRWNFPLLRRIYEHVREHPDQFEMDAWYSLPGSDDDTVHARFRDREIKLWSGMTVDLEIPCGTACCIAGWAQQFTGEIGAPQFAGAAALGLEQDEADALFNLGTNAGAIEALELMLATEEAVRAGSAEVDEFDLVEFADSLDG